MKILFLFTGGTIGSTLNGDLISTDSRKPYLLLEAYQKKYGKLPPYDALEPYTALSENNTGDTLRLLMESVGSHLESGYDAIIITHGTDTLQYSAAALSYAFADCKIPLCLVSSNAPIENPGANGLANLRGAIRFITEVGEPGVFVPYQNKGEPLRIHRGTRLLESVAFSDRVASIHDQYYGSFEEGAAFVPNAAYRSLPDAANAMGAVALPPYCPEILILEPYPGKSYPPLPETLKYVIHTSYHSGTINTAADMTKSFFEALRERGIIPYLTGVSRGAAYESTALFEELGIHPLYNLAPIAAFIKLFMWNTLHPDLPATDFLSLPLAGDIVP